MRNCIEHGAKGIEFKTGSYYFCIVTFIFTSASLKLTSPFISPIYHYLDVTFETVPGFRVQRFRVHVASDPMIRKHCDLPRHCRVTAGGKTPENNLTTYEQDR
jgi:hypothetical protein